MSNQLSALVLFALSKFVYSNLFSRRISLCVTHTRRKVRRIKMWYLFKIYIFAAFLEGTGKLFEKFRKLLLAKGSVPVRCLKSLFELLLTYNARHLLIALVNVVHDSIRMIRCSQPAWLADFRRVINREYQPGWQTFWWVITIKTKPGCQTLRGLSLVNTSLVGGL